MSTHLRSTARFFRSSAPAALRCSFRKSTIHWRPASKTEAPGGTSRSRLMVPISVIMMGNTSSPTMSASPSPACLRVSITACLPALSPNR